MFETVAAPRPIDPGRRATSLALALLLNLAGLGALVALGSRVIEQVVPEDLPVRLTFLEAIPAPPPGPAAPPARARAAAPARSAPAPAPAPTPEPAPEPALGVQTDALSDANGPPEGGEGEGEGPGGEGEGEGVGGGARAVHWSEVRVKRRVEPRFPEAARQLELTDTRCTLHLVIDEHGVPSDVQARSCNKVFAPSALEAAWQWRFYPMKVNGQAVPASFDLSIVYKLR